MSAAAQRKQPLILVSEDHDPDVWRSLDEEESEFESWAAVAQDIWGRGCFLPGQAQAVREAADAIADDKAQTVAIVGCAVGGVEALAGARIEVFECDLALLMHLQQSDGAAPIERTEWNPAALELQADRYRNVVAQRALSLCANPAAAVATLVAAVKAGGRLVIDDLYAADPSVAALVAQGIAGPGHKLALHPATLVMEALKAQALELRANVVANDQLMVAIRAGLSQAVDIAHRLKVIPQPFRKQRMIAFADELQRAVVLHQALEKGLVTSMRTVHGKPAKP